MHRSSAGRPSAWRTAREVDRHDLFGEQAARETLIGLQGSPPADILAGLRAAAVRHAEGRPADDLCMVAVRLGPCLLYTSDAADD